MRQFLITNDKGEITHFRMGTFYEDALANVRSAIALVLMGLAATKDLFGLKINDGMDLINKRFESLIEQIEKENQPDSTNSP
jgi:hypothetical protein